MKTVTHLFSTAQRHWDVFMILAPESWRRLNATIFNWTAFNCWFETSANFKMLTSQPLCQQSWDGLSVKSSPQSVLKNMSTVCWGCCQCIFWILDFHKSVSGARIMKTSQWRLAVEKRCVFSARLKVLFDRSGDRSASGRRFHVAGPLTAELRCPVAVRARGTSRVPVAADRRCWPPDMTVAGTQRLPR